MRSIDLSIIQLLLVHLRWGAPPAQQVQEEQPQPPRHPPPASRLRSSLSPIKYCLQPLASR